MSITVSNASGNFADASFTVTQAFAGNITSGNRIVVMGVAWDGGSASNPFVAGDCTKTAGTATIGAVTLDVTRTFNHFGAESITVGIWSAPVTGTGSCTMQVNSTASGGSYVLIGIAEMSSNEGAITLDQTTSAEGASGAPDSGSLTPAHADAVFMGALATSVASPTTHTPDAAFTQVYEQEDGANHQTGSFIYRVVTSATADSASWTAPTTASWAAALAVYVEPDGGGGGGISIPVVHHHRQRNF